MCDTAGAARPVTRSLSVIQMANPPKDKPDEESPPPETPQPEVGEVAQIVGDAAPAEVVKIPDVLPVLPVRGTVMFPGTVAG